MYMSNTPDSFIGAVPFQGSSDYSVLLFFKLQVGAPDGLNANMGDQTTVAESQPEQQDMEQTMRQPSEQTEDGLPDEYENFEDGGDGADYTPDDLQNVELENEESTRQQHEVESNGLAGFRDGEGRFKDCVASRETAVISRQIGLRHDRTSIDS